MHKFMYVDASAYDASAYDASDRSTYMYLCMEAWDPASDGILLSVSVAHWFKFKINGVMQKHYIRC